MSKHMKGLRATTLMLAVAMMAMPLTGCKEEQPVQQSTEDKKDVVYVQDNNGDWVEMAMFMMLMNNNSAMNYNNYHYATRGANGTYSSYKPTTSEFTAMKSGTYTGHVNNVPATMTSAKPAVANTTAKSTATGQTTSVGGSSTRSTSTGIGG